MKTMNIILPLCLAITATGTSAQSIGPATFNNAGGSGAIGTNNFDWSVGEMPFVNTYSSSAFVITQGLLQPYDATASVNDVYVINNLRVFPTPAENTIYLQPAFAGGGIMQWVLQDVAGRTLAANEVKLVTGDEKQTLNMSAFPVGAYMLQVVYKQGGKTYKAPYKIHKVN